MFQKWFRPEREPCPEHQTPWFQLKVGDFKLEAERESILAISPMVPIVMRSVWRILLLSAAFAGGIGAANMDTKLCDQPGNPAAPVVEELRPHK